MTTETTETDAQTTEPTQEDSAPHEFTAHALGERTSIGSSGCRRQLDRGNRAQEGGQPGGDTAAKGQQLGLIDDRKIFLIL